MSIRNKGSLHLVHEGAHPLVVHVFVCMHFLFAYAAHAVEGMRHVILGYDMGHLIRSRKKQLLSRKSIQGFPM